MKSTVSPASSSISATEGPTSTLIVEATRIVPASSAAIAMSLNLYLLESGLQLVEAIGSSTAVGREPHPAAARLTIARDANGARRRYRPRRRPPTPPPAPS